MLEYVIHRSNIALFDVLFFFKQKTAYEMRISDWSSDVCSSDLVCEIVAALLAGTGVVAHFIGGKPSAGSHLAGQREHIGAGVLAEGLEQIGRASCRERVCQYV